MGNLRTQEQIRQFREEIAAIEATENEKQMAPIRAAQEEQNRLLAEIQKVEREIVHSGRPDEQFVLPESVAGKNMSLDEAKKFNAIEAKRFCESTPDFYSSAANIKAMSDYLMNQGVSIADVETYARAFERLRYLRLLEERPAPAPVIEVQPMQPQVDPTEEKRIAREKYMTEIVVTDPRNGQEYTAYQLEHLPADEYRRLMFGDFSIPKVTDVIRHE